MKKRVADFITAIVTAVLSLLTALAWYLVIQGIIKKQVGADGSLIGVIIFAVIITIVTIAIGLWMHHLAHKIK